MTGWGSSPLRRTDESPAQAGFSRSRGRPSASSAGGGIRSDIALGSAEHRACSLSDRVAVARGRNDELRAAPTTRDSRAQGARTAVHRYRGRAWELVLRCRPGGVGALPGARSKWLSRPKRRAAGTHPEKHRSSASGSTRELRGDMLRTHRGYHCARRPGKPPRRATECLSTTLSDL